MVDRKSATQHPRPLLNEEGSQFHSPSELYNPVSGLAQSTLASPH